MTPNEFKAWMDGFSQGVGDAPTADQWAVVKAKIATIASEAMPQIHLPDYILGQPKYNPLYPSTGSYPAVTCGNIGVTQ